MLRVFLPVCRELDDLVRWSDFMPLDHETASLEWRQVVEQARGDHPWITDFAPATGELDVHTRAALVDAVGSFDLSSLRWMGYGEGLRTRHPVRVFGTDYYRSTTRVSSLETERRIPEFAWDNIGEVAWGARLYGDSFVIAANPDISRRLHCDPRIDTIAVRKKIDIMPRSAGD